jgi:hypothetical protein
MSLFDIPNVPPEVLEVISDREGDPGWGSPPGRILQGVEV